jgi:hypothetical protein
VTDKATLKGGLEVTGGSTSLGGDISFSGTAPRAINGPTNAELKVASTAALTLTGNANSTFDLGAGHTLTLQSSNGEIKTGTGLVTTGGSLQVNGKATVGNALEVTTGGASVAGGLMVSSGATKLTGGDLIVSNGGPTLFEVVGGTVQSGANLTPITGVTTADLGSTTNRWQNAFLSGDVNAKNVTATGDVTAKNVAGTSQLAHGDTTAKGAGTVGFYGAVPVGQHTMATKDDAVTANTKSVCTDAGCTPGAKVDVADSNSVTEVKTLRDRVNELENTLSTYGLLKKAP